MPYSGSSSLALVLSTVQTVLESAHTWSGLPWWATIFAGTIALKVGVFPLTVFQLRNTRRMVDAQPDLQKLRTAFSGALGRHARADALERSSKYLLYARGMRAIWAKHECHPSKSFAVALVQIPLFVSFFWGCRTMVRAGDASFATEGLLWFPDLTSHDPTHVLPLTCLALTYCSLELALGPLAKASGDGVDGADKSLTWRLKDTAQVALIVASPAIAYFPAGIFMYWLPSSMLGMVQSAALATPEVRAALSGSGSAMALSDEEKELAKGVAPVLEAQSGVEGDDGEAQTGDAK